MCALYATKGTKVRMETGMKIILAMLLPGYFLMAQSLEQRVLEKFTGVKVSEGINLNLKKGEQESVKLAVEGTHPDNVITEVSGDYLKIYLKPGQYRNVKVKAEITYTQLSMLMASSGARVYSDEPVRAKSIKIHASSDATVELLIEAGETEVHASSAADVTLRGKTSKLIADISSAGSLQALDFRADAVQVDVSSEGTACVHALQELEARASSAGAIRCKGNPARFLTHSSSAGSIRPID